MAIRERKGRKSPWQTYWNNPITGKRESANFVTRLDAEKHDSLIKHRMRFDRESFQREEVEPKKESIATLESCYLLYLREKQFSKKGIAWQMDGMRLPLERFGNMSIGSITRKDITKLMNDMLKTNVKPVTVRGRLSIFRTVLRWCATEGYSTMPDFPRLPPAHYEKFVPPSPEELQAIIAAASEHIVRAIILGAQLGVRVGPSELMCLTWEDVDLDRGILRVHGSKKNPQAPWREVPIREDLIPAFGVWKSMDKDCPSQHIIHYLGKPVRCIKRAWAATLRRAGITRRIRPYDLRHAFGTDLIAAGVDVGTVAKLMGHSTPTMLLTHYQYVMDIQKKSAVESLPEIRYVPKSMCPKKTGTYRTAVSA